MSRRRNKDPDDPPGMSGSGDYTLPSPLVDLARQVIEANRAAGRKLAVAESCTGGLVSAALTEIAGSSDVFETGFVTYSNEAKIEVLDVSPDVIETFGSVSIAAAWAMAHGAMIKPAPMSRWRLPASPGPAADRRRSRSARWCSPAPSATAIPTGSSPTRKEFGDLGRAGVRLQAALCALELLLPDAPVP